MSQNSVILPTTGTVSGLQMAQAMNNALDTLNTLYSGAGAPSAPEAGQLWHDTGNNIIKLRSADNTSWIALLAINESAYLAAPISQMSGANRLINGGMAIDQMNEGGSYAVANNNTYTYTVDQWLAACLSSTASGITVQRVSDAPAGFANSLKLTVGTGASSVGGTDYLALWQPVEANNISDLGFGTASANYVSLSFWVKASIAGTYAVTLQNTAGTRSYVNKFTIASGGVWQLVTIPGIPGDQAGSWTTGNAACLNVYFVVAVGSTYQAATLNSWQTGAYYGSSTQTNSVLTTSAATFQVTGVMLSAGMFAPPFEKRTIQQELMLCQRYYEKTFNAGLAVAQNVGIALGDICLFSVSTAAGVNYVWWHFNTRKRTTPTVVTYNPSAANANWRDTTASTDKAMATMSSAEWGTAIWVNANTAIGDNLRIHITANSRM